MAKTVIVVIDGFGVGAMPDAGTLRPGDLNADTCGHVLDHCRAAFGRPLRLPVLGALGLGLVHPHPDLARRTHLPVAAGRAALGYPGADTFAGHQTMMGADFSRVTVARLADHLDEVSGALTAAGHRVERLDGKPLLVVDGAVLVHDNLEADPGINWNASGRLDDLPFDGPGGILAIARTVRAVAPVARVIAVGGHADGPLRDFVRPGDGETVGLDTPATGFYRNGGLQVQHLGAPSTTPASSPSWRLGPESRSPWWARPPTSWCAGPRPVIRPSPRPTCSRTPWTRYARRATPWWSRTSRRRTWRAISRTPRGTGSCWSRWTPGWPGSWHCSRPPVTG